MRGARTPRAAAVLVTIFFNVPRNNAVALVVRGTWSLAASSVLGCVGGAGGWGDAILDGAARRRAHRARARGQADVSGAVPLLRGGARAGPRRRAEARHRPRSGDLHRQRHHRLPGGDPPPPRRPRWRDEAVGSAVTCGDDAVHDRRPQGRGRLPRRGGGAGDLPAADAGRGRRERRRRRGLRSAVAAGLRARARAGRLVVVFMRTSDVTAEGPRATRREWIGLAVIALPCLLYSMDLTVLNLAVPHMSADLEPSASQLLWIVDIYGFLIAGSLITMGTLGDRIGRRRLLLIGAT